MDCNCKECPYMTLLAKKFDIHVWKEDCDRYETDYCKKQKLQKGVYYNVNVVGFKEHIIL